MPRWFHGVGWGGFIPSVTSSFINLNENLRQLPSQPLLGVAKTWMKYENIFSRSRADSIESNQEGGAMYIESSPNPDGYVPNSSLFGPWIDSPTQVNNFHSLDLWRSGNSRQIFWVIIYVKCLRKIVDNFVKWSIWW